MSGSLGPLLAFPGVFINFVRGQNGFLAAALMGGALLLPRRPVWAGILIGLLTIKPHLGVLWPVALICGRHWRALFSAALSSMLFLGLSVLMLGTNTLSGFFASLETFANMAFQDGSMFAKIPSFLSFSSMLGLSRHMAFAVHVSVAVPVVAAVAWVWLRCRRITFGCFDVGQLAGQSVRA
ncbi:MAG: hypothetical protein JWR07_1587 [Nevskia sp.]|nr:hypothetical protein [Nevskia sp.]